LGYRGGTQPASGSGGTDAGTSALRYAVSQAGKPYSFTADPPDSWDCSKLTAWSWAVATGADPNKGYYDSNAKVRLTPYSHVQAQQIDKRVISKGPGASIAGLVPGDILYFSGTSGQSGGHTSIYAGNNRVFEASSPSVGLRYADLNNSWNKQYFRWAGAPKGFAAGGFVRGSGGPRADMIPAMLSNGEYVMKAGAVDKYGRGFMDQINSGNLNMPSFGMPSMPTSPSSSIATNVNGGSYSSSNSSNNVKIVINGASGKSATAIANKVASMINSSNNRRNHSRSI
jgi:hypothetical protein